MEDVWYDGFLRECRDGSLSQESLYFLFGLPTEHVGSWVKQDDGSGRAMCGTAQCQDLHIQWARMAKEGRTWASQEELECQHCQAERQRRNRLVSSGWSSHCQIY